MTKEELLNVLRGIDPGGCREWVGTTRCPSPAEFVLWGKLIDKEGLGPRCYDHAAKHVGHRALGDPSWAIIDLRPLRRVLDGRARPAAVGVTCPAPPPEAAHNPKEAVDA